VEGRQIVLNELLIIERGVPQQEVTKELRHDDIHEAARNVHTLHVWLDATGAVTNMSPVPDTARLWTIRNHNENSFPFIQIKKPLLSDIAAKSWKEWRKVKPHPKPQESRAQLIHILNEITGLYRQLFDKWSTDSVMAALRQRLNQVKSLKQTDAAVLPAALERFLLAYDTASGVLKLLEAIQARLVQGLKETATDAWLACAIALLVEEKGAIYIDADGQWPCSLLNRKIIAFITDALDSFEKQGNAIEGVCALTGEQTQLVSNTFPQPDLPTIGPTTLFSRHDGRPANERYGKFGCDTMSAGHKMTRRLAAAARVLAPNEQERRGQTWQSIPGERPKQTDLLIAFVESVPDAPVVETMAEDDFSEENPQSTTDVSDSVAAFEKRTERLIQAIQAKVGADFRQTPVRLAVLRKVDKSNRKVVYAGSPTVGDLYEAATAWLAGERNVPPQLALLPHVAPLAMIRFSKQLFLRNGKRPDGKKKELIGLATAESLGLFLESDVRRVQRVLQMVLVRRTTLLCHVAHIRHAPMCWKRRETNYKTFDHEETRRTVAVLGVLLYKLGRKKEDYMNDTAFKLGQFLAAADVVHAGYCADVRGGAIPPSLLGNQVFAIAQTAPTKAFSMLCQRWKPYAGWTNKAARECGRADTMIASSREDERQRGWDIKKALRYSREIKVLAEELREKLPSCVVGDAFRAELLLGYVAGLPKSQYDNIDDEEQTTPDSKKEN
jgi:hypothetical protein